MPRYILLIAIVASASGCGSSQNADSPKSDSSGALNSLADLNFKSWGELESELTSGTPTELKPGESVYDRILDRKLSKRIRDAGTPALWKEMYQSSEPFVALLAYRCVAETSPDRRFATSLEVLSRREAGTSLYLFPEPLKVLNEVSPTEARLTEFATFVSKPDNEKLNLREVTAFLSDEFIEAFAAHPGLTSTPPAVQAMAISAAYASAAENATPVSTVVSKVFNSFSESSSDRLAIFVWHAPDTVAPERLTAAIVRLLRDDNVPDHMYEIALYQKLDFIKTNLDPKKLDLDAAQRKKFEAFLAKRAGG